MTGRFGNVRSPSALRVGALRLGGSALALALVCSALGCGHTEEEWQWQLDKLARAQGDAAAMQGKLDQAVRGCEAKGGQNPAPLSAALEEREHALADYKVRAKALEMASTQGDALRAKLAEVTAQGVTVGIRRGRLTITVPGDLLFQPFRGDGITRPGQKVLQKIGAALKGDAQLVNRNWEVVGHTDDKKLDGGVYRDALGVSLMHAREVLANVVAAGGLLPQHWSASGYADADPVAPNDTADNRTKNRRVELVLVTPGDEPQPLPQAAPAPPPTGPVAPPAPPGALAPQPKANPTGP